MMTPERLQFFKDWIEGAWPNGSPHIPDGVESWTRELVTEIERSRRPPEFKDESDPEWRTYTRLRDKFERGNSEESKL